MRHAERLERRGSCSIVAGSYVDDRALERGVGTDLAIPFVRT